MNPITAAISAGYTVTQILNFLKNSSSKLNSKITKATASGYAANEILGLLSSSSQNDMDKEYESSGKILGKEKKRKQDLTKELLKKGIKYGSLAYATGMLGSGISNQSAQAIPPSQIIQTGLPGSVGQLPGQATRLGLPAPGPNAPTPGPMNPQGQPSPPIPQAPISPPNAPIAPNIKSNAIQALSKLGLAQNVKNMIRSGNDPKTISQILQYVMKPDQKKEFQSMMKSGEIESFDKLIEDYITESQAQQLPIQTQPSDPIQQNTPGTPPVTQINTPENTPLMQEMSPAQEQPLQEPIEPEPIQVGSQVITPDGDIGTIEHLPGKTAKIKTDLGSKIAKTDELTPVPKDPKLALQKYKELIESIPENLRSAILNMVEYDELNNNLYVKFHNGSSYFYEDIPEKDIFELKELMQPAKTSGENIFGVWAEGEGSRGAKMHQIIQRIQKERGGKGKEYKGKFKNVYDYMAYPKGLLKEEESERREREKQEKREAKIVKKPKKPNA